MITQYTSPLIPDSVVNGKFPRADEDKLTGLGAEWMKVDTEMTSEAGSLTTLSRTVFANWSGGSADTAYSQIDAVTKFSSSVATAASTISAGCKKAASYVANTKAGINAVLIHLDNLTKEQILLGLSNPLLVPLCLQRILDLRTRAKAIVNAYSEALISAMAGITFTVTIQPRPSSASGSSATTASAQDVQLSAPPAASHTQPSGGASSTATATSATGATATTAAATSTGTGSAAATTAGSAIGAWTGGLAALKNTDVTSVITKAPPSDASSGAGAGTKTTGSDASPTAKPASAGQQSGSTFGPTTTAPATVPTDGSGLMGDKGSLYKDMGQTPPPSSTTDAVTGTPPGGNPLHQKVMQSITDQVAGNIPAHDVAKALDHSTTWSNPAGGPSSAAAQPTQGATPAVNAGGGGVSGGGTPSTGGAQQSWTTAHPASVANPAPAPAATNPAPGGTGAAGSDGSASATIQNTTPAPVAPVMPVTNTTTLFSGSPGGVTPNIQIAPGTGMPTTGFSGAPTGTGAFPTATNVPPVGNIAAPAAAVPTTAVPASSAVPPTSVPPVSSPTAAPAAQAAAPHQQAAAPANAAQPLRIDAPRGTPAAAPGGAGPEGGVVTVATAIAALGLVGAAAQHFTGLWHDLGSTTLLRPVGTILPTQFGRDDELLASMPLGMETVYQKVLLPGEADQLFTGQVETLRGLVYPYQAVRELRTPSELYDALGLGFVVSGVAGSDTLAFNRDAESVDVLRCAGLRQDDLVTPIDSDVNLPDGTLPPPLVRHHRRPWTGTGEAPGSTSENVIEEHEILGYASVGVPHLAEIWRLHADGAEEHVSTYNARNGQWVGDTSPRQALVGRRIDNGAYAGLSDGTVFRTIVLTDADSVLIAYGVSAPEHFEPAHDGSHRTTVSNTDIVSLTGVATIGTWRALPIQLLHRQGTTILVDYAGDDPAAAAAAGFLQVNQGQWQPRWVEHTEVVGIQELERHYAPPRAAAPWQNGPEGPSPAMDRERLVVDEPALGAVR